MNIPSTNNGDSAVIRRVCGINVCDITVLMHCSVSCVLTDFSLLIMKTGAVDIFGSTSKRLFLFPVVPSWVFSLVIGEHTSEVAYLRSKLKTLSLLLALWSIMSSKPTPGPVRWLSGEWYLLPSLTIFHPSLFLPPYPSVTD